LKLDTNGKITTQFYDKRDDLIFSIISFPYLCSNISASPVYGVYFSQLLRYAIACSAYNQLYRQTKWCHRGFNSLVCRLLSANFTVVAMILFAHTTLCLATCCLICFMSMYKLSYLSLMHKADWFYEWVVKLYVYLK
jgi:hypothetical protein